MTSLPVEILNEYLTLSPHHPEDNALAEIEAIGKTVNTITKLKIVVNAFVILF